MTGKGLEKHSEGNNFVLASGAGLDRRDISYLLISVQCYFEGNPLFM